MIDLLAAFVLDAFTAADRKKRDAIDDVLRRQASLTHGRWVLKKAIDDAPEASILGLSVHSPGRFRTQFSHHPDADVSEGDLLLVARLTEQAIVEAALRSICTHPDCTSCSRDRDGQPGFRRDDGEESNGATV